MPVARDRDALAVEGARFLQGGPERHLWAAVLDNGVACARSLSPDIRSDALDWINSDDEDLGSFVWVCSSLGFDAGQIRQQVIRRNGHHQEVRRRVIFRGSRSRQTPG